MDTLRDRLGTWFKPYAALFLTILVGGVVIVSLALLGAEVYDNVVDSAGLANLDKPALALSESLRSPGLDAFVTGFTNIGGGIGMPILASILTAWLTYLSRNWRPLILIGGAERVSQFSKSFAASPSAGHEAPVEIKGTLTLEEGAALQVKKQSATGAR